MGFAVVDFYNIEKIIQIITLMSHMLNEANPKYSSKV